VLGQNLKKGVPTFFLFEENPYWYSIAAEVILRGQEKGDQNLIIIGNSMIVPILRNKKWYASHRNIDGLCQRAKGYIRSCTFLVLKFARPSSRIYKLLANESKIHIAIIKKTQLREFSRLLEKRKLLISEKHIHTIIESCLSEEFATNYPLDILTPSRYERLYCSIRGIESALIEILDQIGPSVIQLVNGRTLHEKILVEVAKKNEIVIEAFESEYGSNILKRFDESVLKSVNYNDNVENFWTWYCSQHGSSKAHQVAKAYFTSRRTDPKVNKFIAGNKMSATIWSNSQQKTYLLCTSSNDELGAIYYERGMPQIDQISHLQELMEFFESQDSSRHRLIVRIHPNLLTKNPKDKEEWEIIRSSENVLVFKAESKVSTYSLIDVADVVITFGSTVGIEAAYMGKPVFLLGETVWAELGIETKIATKHEILRENEMNLAKSKLQATKLGLYFAAYGSEFKYINSMSTTRIDLNYPIDFFRKPLIIMSRFNARRLGFPQYSKPGSK
jgi:hypothetical protein